MYETINKQVVMGGLSSDKSLNNPLPLDELIEVPIGDAIPDNPVAALITDDSEESETDVSNGDVSNGDISGGDISGGNPYSAFETTCAYVPKPLLWESDIAEYDTTDGLLLLILIFTMLNTAWNVLGKRG